MDAWEALDALSKAGKGGDAAKPGDDKPKPKRTMASKPTTPHAPGVSGVPVNVDKFQEHMSGATGPTIPGTPASMEKPSNTPAPKKDKGDVKSPGSRGGKWYRTKVGEIRYGQKPSGPHEELQGPPDKSHFKPGHTVDWEHPRTGPQQGEVVAAHSTGLVLKNAEGDHYAVPYSMVRGSEVTEAEKKKAAEPTEQHGPHTMKQGDVAIFDMGGEKHGYVTSWGAEGARVIDMEANKELNVPYAAIKETYAGKKWTKADKDSAHWGDEITFQHPETGQVLKGTLKGAYDNFLRVYTGAGKDSEVLIGWGRVRRVVAKNVKKPDKGSEAASPSGGGKGAPASSAPAKSADMKGAPTSQAASGALDAPSKYNSAGLKSGDHIKFKDADGKDAVGVVLDPKWKGEEGVVHISVGVNSGKPKTGLITVADISDKAAAGAHGPHNMKAGDYVTTKFHDGAPVKVTDPHLTHDPHAQFGDSAFRGINTANGDEGVYHHNEITGKAEKPADKPKDEQTWQNGLGVVLPSGPPYGGQGEIVGYAGGGMYNVKGKDGQVAPIGVKVLEHHNPAYAKHLALGKDSSDASSSTQDSSSSKAQDASKSHAVGAKVHVGDAGAPGSGHFPGEVVAVHDDGYDVKDANGHVFFATKDEVAAAEAPNAEAAAPKGDIKPADIAGIDPGYKAGDEYEGATGKALKIVSIKPNGDVVYTWGQNEHTLSRDKFDEWHKGVVGGENSSWTKKPSTEKPSTAEPAAASTALNAEPDKYNGAQIAMAKAAEKHGWSFHGDHSPSGNPKLKHANGETVTLTPSGGWIHETKGGAGIATSSSHGKDLGAYLADLHAGKAKDTSGNALTPPGATKAPAAEDVPEGANAEQVAIHNQLKSYGWRASAKDSANGTSIVYRHPDKPAHHLYVGTNGTWGVYDNDGKDSLPGANSTTHGKGWVGIAKYHEHHDAAPKGNVPPPLASMTDNSDQAAHAALEAAGYELTADHSNSSSGQHTVWKNAKGQHIVLGATSWGHWKGDPSAKDGTGGTGSGQSITNHMMEQGNNGPGEANKSLIGYLKGSHATKSAKAAAETPATEAPSNATEEQQAHYGALVKAGWKPMGKASGSDPLQGPGGALKFQHPGNDKHTLALTPSGNLVENKADGAFVVHKGEDINHAIASATGKSSKSYGPAEVAKGDKVTIALPEGGTATGKVSSSAKGGLMVHTGKKQWVQAKYNQVLAHTKIIPKSTGPLGVKTHAGEETNSHGVNVSQIALGDQIKTVSGKTYTITGTATSSGIKHFKAGNNLIGPTKITEHTPAGKLSPTQMKDATDKWGYTPIKPIDQAGLTTPSPITTKPSAPSAPAPGFGQVPKPNIPVGGKQKVEEIGPGLRKITVTPEAKLDPEAALKSVVKPDFMNWGGTGKHGPSSSIHFGKANQAAVEQIAAAAKTGNIDAIKAVSVQGVDKATGEAVPAATKNVMVADSVHVKGYAENLIKTLNEQLHPVEHTYYELTGEHPLKAISEAVKPMLGTALKQHLASGGKKAKYVDLGHVDPLSPEQFQATFPEGHLSDEAGHKIFQSKTKAVAPKIPSDMQSAIQSLKDSSHNSNVWAGNEDGQIKKASQAVHEHGFYVPTNVILHRHINVHGPELQQLINSPGHILQEMGWSHSSPLPNTWNGNVHLKMSFAPGVKALHVGPGSGISSSHGSEHEAGLPANTRLWVQRVEKHGGDSISVHVIVLPHPKDAAPKGQMAA